MTARSKTGKGHIRLNAKLNAILMRELMDGPCTQTELRKVTGMCPRTTSDYLMALYHKGCVRICGWERDASGKQSIRVFEFGEGPDAKKEPGKRSQQHIQEAQERRVHRVVTRLAA